MMPNAMRYVPGARKTSASSKQTRNVKNKGQEVLKVIRSSSRGVKVNSEHRDVVDNVKCDGICSRSEENERIIEMNAQHRDQGVEGAEGDQVKPRGVEVYLDHQNVVDDA